MWDPPLTAGTLDSLHYRVIVANNDTGVVIVSNTTTVTTQPLPHVQLCQYYTANVTAFSSEYHGDSVVTGERSPGGMCVHVQVLVCKNDIIHVYHSFRILPGDVLISKCWFCYVIHSCVFYWTKSKGIKIHNVISIYVSSLTISCLVRYYHVPVKS